MNAPPQMLPQPQNDEKVEALLENSDLSPSVDSQMRREPTGNTTPGATYMHPSSILQYPGLPGLHPGTGVLMNAHQTLLMSMPALVYSAAYLFAMAAASGMSTVPQHYYPSATLLQPQTPAPLHLPPPTGQQPSLNVTLGNNEENKRGPLLYISTDDAVLSENQIVLRKQIEFFEASLDDVGRTTSGRRHPILMNQVGIQCRHCSSIPARYRQRGAIYYPAKLTGIYQASQNMAVAHMANLCQFIDSETKERLQTYQKARAAMGHGGKHYWADTARAQGVVESEEGGLRFSNPPHDLVAMGHASSSTPPSPTP